MREDVKRELVRHAQSEGMSWQAIGDVFGTSRHAVTQRYAHGLERHLLELGS